MSVEVRPKNIVGYADRTSVRPGESIEFMVGAYTSGRYSARVVRLPDGSHMPSPVDGDYPAREQLIHPGSFAVVPGVRTTPSFTAQAMVWPTTPGGRVQAILTSGMRPETGFALYMDEEGAVVASVGDAKVSSEMPLRALRWYAVSASYDSETGVLTVEQRPVRPTAAEPEADESVRVQREIGPGRVTGETQTIGFAA